MMTPKSLLVLLLAWFGPSLALAQENWMESFQDALNDSTSEPEAASSPPEEPVRIGIVNVEQLVFSHPQAIEMRQRAMRLAASAQDRLDDQRAHWVQRVTDLMRRVGSSSVDDIQADYQILLEERERILSAEQALLQAARQVDLAIQDQVMRDARAIWPSLLRSNRLDMILSSDALMSYDASADVTILVLSRVEERPDWRASRILQPLRSLT